MRLRKRRLLLILLIICILLCAASFISFVLSMLHNSFSSNYRTSQSQCEVVHVGVVSVGYDPSFDFHTMLKSLFFYRDNPLQFHIIVDDVSEKTLRTLFDTWAIPHIAVSFYNIYNIAPDLSSLLKKQHYPETPELLKLTFSKIIPTGVTNKIIVLDQHLFFADDIYDLWKLFADFNERQLVGLVENQGNNYARKEDLPFRSTYGKRFNYGVILCHLERFRSAGWDDLWSDIANETAFRIGVAGLADHNIINTVMSENWDMVYTLSCHWNTHFHGSKSEYSCFNNNEIKIMHWNIPKKSNVNDEATDYFTAMYTMFAEYNGNLLRRHLHGCAEASDVVFTNEAIDECYDFREAHTHKWRTLLFFRKFKYTATKDDVTFVSQLTYDRLQLLEELCERWDGPMSLTLYVTDAELEKSVNFIENSTILQNRFNIGFHAVFKEDYYHPINILRNVALRNVITPYVFVDDVDLLPMQGIYSSFKEYLSGMESMEKKALIVPAFQTMQYGGEIPKSKLELSRLLESRILIPFSYYRFPEGHGPTNYTKLKSAVAPYKVEWQADYEPYILVQRNVSEYDERFVGYGWDKSSHIMKLEAQGYEFIVLPNAFVAHKDHPPSSDESHFLELPRYRSCLENLNRKIVKELNEKYGRQFSIK